MIYLGSHTGEEIELESIRNHSARKGWWSARHPGRFIPDKDSVHIVKEVGWVSGPNWLEAENPAPRGFDPRAVQPVIPTTLSRPPPLEVVMRKNMESRGMITKEAEV